MTYNVPHWNDMTWQKDPTFLLGLFADNDSCAHDETIEIVYEIQI
jgi:hypothetical protein